MEKSLRETLIGKTPSEAAFFFESIKCIRAMSERGEEFRRNSIEVLSEVRFSILGSYTVLVFWRRLDYQDKSNQNAIWKKLK